MTPETNALESIGQTVQLSGVVRDAQGAVIPGVALSWQSSAGTIASVTSAGLVAAIANGSVQITATTGTVMGSATVNVNQVVTTVAVTPPATTLTSIGVTVPLAAQARDANGNPVVGATFSWQSSNAAVASVSATGIVTANSIGSATITATSGTVNATASIRVAQAVAGVSVAPPAITLVSLGETVQLAAVVVDANANPIPNAVVTWQTSAQSVATASTVGLVTAVANGSATITATSATKSGTASIQVTQTASTVTVTPSAKTLTGAGQTVQMAAAVKDARGNAMPAAPVTWNSSNDLVASVSNTGLVTSRANGSATITASSGAAAGNSVVQVAQQSIEVAPPALTLAFFGQSGQLTATVSDASGNPVPGAPVSWQSSAPGVATVSAAGLATAVGNGSATVTATSGTVFATASVQVSQTPFSITVAPAGRTTLAPSQTLQITPTVRDQGGNVMPSVPVTWQSTDLAVATVSATGLVTAQGAGTASIVGTVSTPGGNRTAAAAISVQVPIAALVITNQPSNGIASSPLLEFVKVELRAGDGSVITSANNPVTMTLLAGANLGVLTSSSTVTASNGIASFFGLQVSKPGVGYRVRFDVAGGPSVTSNTFDVVIKFTAISAGEAHTCGVDVDFVLWCWGENGSGELGQGPGDLADHPVPVRVATSIPWRGVWAGSKNTCARTQTNEAYCWGGSFTSTPTLVPGAPSMLTVPVSNHVCGDARASVAIFCWGANESGQLGRNTMTAFEPSALQPVRPPTQVEAIPGATFSCGLNDPGDAYCWGSNGEGELGTGNLTPSLVPVAVTGGRLFVRGILVAEAGLTTCGFESDYKLFCWGRNIEGEFGNAGTNSSSSPTLAIGGRTDFFSIVLGFRHGCALTGGSVYCWGRNTAGELGTAAGAPLLTPTQTITTLPLMTRLTAGHAHTCGLMSAGNVYCWGNNGSGRLGTGTAGGPTPAPVAAVP